MAHNALHDDDTYHRQSIVEAVFFALKQRYSDTLRTRTWFGQFREFILKPLCGMLNLLSNFGQNRQFTKRSEK